MEIEQELSNNSARTVVQELSIEIKYKSLFQSAPMPSRGLSAVYPCLAYNLISDILQILDWCLIIPLGLDQVER